MQLQDVEFHSNVQGFLKNLFSTTMKNEEATFLVESKIYASIIRNDFFNNYTTSMKNSVIVVVDDATNSDYKLFNLVVSEMKTVIFIYYNDLLGFLDKLESNSGWNPKNVILINLSKDSTPDYMAYNKVIHRSRCIILFKYDAKAEMFAVYRVKNLRPGINETESKKKYLGYYDENDFGSSGSLLYDEKIDLSGSVILLSSWCDDFPYLVQTGENTCTGSAVQTMEMLAQAMQLSFVVQMLTDDEEWGSKDNGSWTGMLKGLWTKEKHLVINLFMLTQDRATDFDFTYPHIKEGFGFCIRKPEPLSKSLSLIYPFSVMVWIIFGIITLLVAILLSVILRFRNDTQPYDESFLLVSNSIYH